MTRMSACTLSVWFSVLSGAVNDASSQPLAFAHGQYASSAGARAIVSADFNRDGWPDIAETNGARATVSVLLSREGTDFAAAADVGVGAEPFGLATGDFDRDGIPDLAVANAGADSLSILLGIGDGRFARTDIQIRALRGPRGVAAGDWNNDGTLDLIVTGYRSRSVHVLLGTAEGKFIGGPSHAAGPHPQGVATADFNHDGFLDIAIAYATGHPLTILYGHRGRGFVARDLQRGSHFNVLTTGDFNRDGWADLAAASTPRSSVAVLLGSRRGFTPARDYSSGDSPAAITAADVNHDGLLDLITANRGSGTLSVLAADNRRPGKFLAAVEFAADSGSRDLVAGDFNGDGRLDLATSNEDAAVVTLLTNVTPLTRAAFVFSKVPLLGPSEYFSQHGNHLWTADFNSDGRMDVATIGVKQDDEPAELLVLLNGGPIVALPRLGWYPQAAGVGDVNSDGNPDVIYIDAPGDLYANLGDGRGGFIPAAATPTATHLVSNNAMAVGDLNRDGRSDVAFIGYDFSYGCFVQTMTSKGDGTFAIAVQLPLDASCSRPSLTITDLDRDGRPDVAALTRNVAAGTNDAIWVWMGDGSGGLAASEVVSLDASEADDFEAADIDRDGDVDIVVATIWGIDIVRRTPFGFAQPVHLSSDNFCAPVPAGVTCWADPQTFALADIDGNGTLDIVTAGGTVVHGDGHGNFDHAEGFDFSGAEIAVAELTGDGLLDIAFVTASGAVGMVVNERNDVNRAPDVSAGPDRAIEYQNQHGTQGQICFTVEASGSDPDLHAAAFVWRVAGAVVSGSRSFDVCGALPGVYEYSLEVTDGRGATVADQVVITLAPSKEIVLHVVSPSVEFSGRWSAVPDPTAASSVRAANANLGAPKAAFPSPGSDYVILRFAADPTQTYKLWLRLKADGDSWANDSLWVQFSDATDLAGNPKYRTGTSSGLAISLEECRHCGVQGWGWQDDGWGAPDTSGVLLRFPQGGAQAIVISTREDGVSFDQIVLSSERYLTSRPGGARNDNTILRPTR